MSEASHRPIVSPLRVALTASLLATYLVVALFPFDWEPPVNAAKWLSGGELAFRDVGLARTDGVPNWMPAALRSDQLSIHLRVRPASLEQRAR